MGFYEDSELISKYLSGNEGALEILILRHKQKVYAFIFSKVMDKDIAEDIFQDTFMKVILTLKEGKYNEEGKFLPWLMRIAHNLTIDFFRSQKRMPTIGEVSYGYEEEYNFLELLSSSDDSVETKLIKNQIDADLSKLLDCLPEDQKDVLHMRLYKEMSFKEISEETNVSINTALGRMRYALINLRKIIDEKNIILTVD